MVSRTDASTVVYVVLALVATAHACIFKYGDAPFVQRLGLEFTFAYHGNDWTNSSWSCLSGKRQSPINIAVTKGGPKLHPMPEDRRTILDFGTFTSNGTNVDVINTGYFVQLEWNDPNWNPRASVVVAEGAQVINDGLDPSVRRTKRIPIRPLQFHFHTHEHMLQGHMYPMEMHIVSEARQEDLPGCESFTCFAAVGVLMQLHPDLEYVNEAFEDIWSVMPLFEGTKTKLPAGSVVNFDRLLPQDRSYVTYEGSLTFPPCGEGIRWHVMTQPIHIGMKQWTKFKMAVGDNNCTHKAVPDDYWHLRTQVDVLDDHDDDQNDGDKGEEKGNCTKLGDGNNSRFVQAINQRKLYRYKQRRP